MPLNQQWTAESIPPELAAIHDAPGGTSLRGLAEILNAYDGLRDGWACALAEEALTAEAGPEWARLVRENPEVPLTLGIGGPVIGAAVVAEDGTATANVTDPRIAAALRPPLSSFSIGAMPARPSAALVEFPAGTTGEKIERFKQGWTGGPLICRRKGDVERVRVTVKWFTTDGSLVDTDCRETTRGPELQTLLAAWSERPLPTWIYVKPIGGADA